MKKILTFVPLGIGISAAIIYMFNVFWFRIINDSTTLIQILSNLKIYLYISIAGFLSYLFIKVLLVLNNKNEYKEKTIVTNDEVECYEPFEVKEQPKIDNPNTYVPNYDYVPRYNKSETIKKTKETVILNEEKINDSDIINGNSYCYNCGEEIFSTDTYCFKCGAVQKRTKHLVNPLLRKIISVLETIILILILYFSVNMLLDYKESKDPNFTSPFKIRMTK